MNQLFHMLDKVALGLGVAQGLMASVDTGLTLKVSAGIARVGSLDGNPGNSNLAARGMNQPGKVIEVGSQTIVVPDDDVSLVWLKTDGTLAVTDNATDVDALRAIAPEKGANVFKGDMLKSGMQQGPLRAQEPASVLLARVTAASGAITEVDNTVRSTILI